MLHLHWPPARSQQTGTPCSPPIQVHYPLHLAHMPAVGAASVPARQAVGQRQRPAQSGASADCKHGSTHLAAGRYPSAARAALAPRLRRLAAAAAAAAGAQTLRIVPSTLQEDLSAAAWLRAEAYYEANGLQPLCLTQQHYPGLA